MLEYNIQLNTGTSQFGSTGTTITVNEQPRTISTDFLAEELHHANELIPKRTIQEVLANFGEVAARLMAEGFAIQFMKDSDVLLRLYADMHVKGASGNINLSRAQELDPTVTAITRDNAGDLVNRAGVSIRAYAEVEQKFTDLLLSFNPSIKRKDIVEKNYGGSTQGGSTDGGGNSGSGNQNQGGGSGNGGDDDGNEG